MGDGVHPLRVVVSDEHGRRLHAGGLGAWLRRAAPARARGAVGIAIVSDKRVRLLNRVYRRKDYATDVLSFPAFAPQHSAGASAGPGVHPFLGDIVIARGVAVRQARAAGHNHGVELRILALHGLLHLLGYDHERDDGRMRRAERRLLRKSGLKDGLIDRVSR